MEKINHEESKKIFERFLDQIDFIEWKLSSYNLFVLDDNWWIDQENLDYTIKISSSYNIKLIHNATGKQAKATIYMSLNKSDEINQGTNVQISGRQGIKIKSHREQFNLMLRAERLEKELKEVSNQDKVSKIKI